jgi:hypothetical protein
VVATNLLLSPEVIDTLIEVCRWHRCSIAFGPLYSARSGMSSEAKNGRRKLETIVRYSAAIEEMAERADVAANCEERPT